MKKLAVWNPARIVIIALFMVMAYSIASSQQSTSGPKRPANVELGLMVEKDKATIIPDIPMYLWHHGCGPTAAGMVAGCWETRNCPTLAVGDASTQTTEVNWMLVTDNGNGWCGATYYYDHYHDYACPRDDSPPLLQDRSELGGAHEDDCLADFLKTSQSLYGNMYGWGWFDHMHSGFIDFFAMKAPYATVTVNDHFFDPTLWDTYVAEIDADRPVVLLVDTDGDGSTDHFVTGVGYQDPATYIIHDTWDDIIRSHTWRELSPGNSWGVYGMVTVDVTVGANVLEVPGEFGDISAAITAAADGDIIVLSPGTYAGPGNIDLTIIGKSIRIYSEAGPERTVIDCEGSDKAPHYGLNFDYQTGTGSLIIDGVKFKNAYSTNVGAVTANFGGNITISNCVFENCYSATGGAIGISSGSMPASVSKCRFIENTAPDRGGAIHSLNRNLSVEDCIFIKNTAPEGGAVYSSGGSLMILRSTLFGNTSDAISGAVYQHGGPLYMERIILSFSTTGQAVDYEYSSTPSLNNCDLYHNAEGNYTGEIAGLLGQFGNLQANPYFCDTAQGDMTICSESQCQPGVNPNGVLIGALGVGCSDCIVFECGDVNDDEGVDILDIIYLIDYKFKGGPDPIAAEAANVDGVGGIDILDIIYLIDFKFKGGPDLICP